MFSIKIKGNVESLRASIIGELESIYDMEFEKDEFVPRELADRLANLTDRINREIAVYIDRRGKVLDVSVGDSRTAPLSEVDGRRSSSRLSGVRCIHTHPGGDGMVSSVDVSSMLNLRLDAIAAIGVSEGRAVEIYVAVPSRDAEGQFKKALVYGPFESGDKRLKALFEVIREIEKAAVNILLSNEEEEKAILVGLETVRRDINGKTEGERLLDELEELANTAGAQVVGRLLQKKQDIDTATYIGKGKLEELGLLRQSLNANLLIFDDELSGAQVRNIEKAAGIKVIDRTALILDIFAKRARSREGKLQVELAQLMYRLPRLTGLGIQLSRLGGGIGTRGPGEKKLEVDKRHIRRRISVLEDELKDVARRRGFMRESRKEFPMVAIVGYTNAGKSTLMNALCKTDVFAEDKLFATLDPTTRSLTLPDGREALLVDTVGFIRKLPHDLVESFKSTLEEAVYADVLLHVVDVSSEETEEHVEVVNSLLKSLGALNKPMVLVLNKMDALLEKGKALVQNPFGPVCEISALTGEGLEELLKEIEKLIPENKAKVSLMVPYSDGWVLPLIHENGKILEEKYSEKGTYVKAEIDKGILGRVQGYFCDEKEFEEGI